LKKFYQLFSFDITFSFLQNIAKGGTAVGNNKQHSAKAKLKIVLERLQSDNIPLKPG